jgi:hypothetical protein
MLPPDEHKEVNTTIIPFVLEGASQMNANQERGGSGIGNRTVSEDDYQLLQIIKAAETSGRVAANYPPNGVVKGWVCIFKGDSVAKEVRCSIKDLEPMEYSSAIIATDCKGLHSKRRASKRKHKSSIERVPCIF